MHHEYAALVHARLKKAATDGGAPCPLIDSIDPGDMVVSQMMGLCRASGVSYASVFDTRVSTDSITSAGSRSRATHSLMK